MIGQVWEHHSISGWILIYFHINNFILGLKLTEIDPTILTPLLSQICLMLQLIQEFIQNIMIQSSQNTTKLTSLKLKVYLKIILESIRYLVWWGICECLCNTWTLQNRHTPVGQIFQMMQNTGQFTKTERSPYSQSTLFLLFTGRPSRNVEIGESSFAGRWAELRWVLSPWG